MSEELFEMDEIPNCKRKSERRQTQRRWVGYDELEDLQDAKPHKQKHPQYDEYEDEDYAPRDSKRDVRKSARRKDKWATHEWDY